MIKFETHNCDACGEQFVVACKSQLQEKLKTHKSCCKGRTVVNKKRERTKQLQQKGIALYVHDTAVNRIEQHNLDKLVSQGMLVNA